MLVPTQFFNDQPPPAALPGSPLFDRLVLERPLVLLVALCAAAGFTLMVAIARDQRRAGATIAALLLLAAAGVFVLSALVQTPREALAARTRTLIAALATVDTPALDDLLADNAVMRYAFARGGIGKDAIITHVQRYLGADYALASHSVREMQATLDGPRVGRTQVRVRAISRAGPRLTSWWLLDWTRGDDQAWRVTQITPLHPLIRASPR